MTSALLPAGPVRRCRCCHRPVPVGPMYDGLGEKCAEKAGLIARKARVRRPRRVAAGGGPGLFALFAAARPVDGDPGQEDLYAELHTED